MSKRFSQCMHLHCGPQRDTDDTAAQSMLYGDNGGELIPSVFYSQNASTASFEGKGRINTTTKDICLQIMQERKICLS